MDKSLIMNNYAIEQGYESWEDLYIQSDMIFRHFHNVTDLIQEELLKKASKQLILGQTLNKAQQSILNTEIL